MNDDDENRENGKENTTKLLNWNLTEKLTIKNKERENKKFQKIKEAFK